MAEKFGFGGTSTKTRTLLLFGGAVSAVIVGLMVSKFSNKGTAEGQAQKSTTVAVPRLDTTPGEKVSERYHNLQTEENEKRAKQAETTGKSAIPTVVGEIKKYDFELPNFQVENIPDAIKKNVDPAKLLPGQSKPFDNAPSVGLPSAPPPLTSAPPPPAAPVMPQNRPAVLSSAPVDNGETYQKMSISAKALIDGWGTVPKQMFVQGANSDAVTVPGMVKDEKGNITYQPESATKTTTAGNTVKAGTIYFAVLDTAINSDSPGPILATMVDGPYKGARLIGSIEKSSAGVGGRAGSGSQGIESVQIKFNRLSVPYHDKSISFDAVAIDPDTARTAMASDVDHHYLLRYGSLFASSFMQGYGQAISQQGTTTVDAADGTTTTQKPSLSGKEQIFAALGQVGQNWSSAVQGLSSIPNTVTVDPGVGFGLLVLSDFEMPKQTEK